MKIKRSVPLRKLNIIFDTTIETEYIKMQHEIQSLKELTIQQALELQKYKKLLDK